MSQNQSAGNEAAAHPETTPLARLQQRLEDAADVANWLGHDFANIFTGVLGFAELALSESPPESEAYEFTLEIQHAASRGQQLVSRLLLFGRRARTQGGTTPLSAFFAGERSRWQELLGSEHALTFDVPSDLPTVSVAPEPLRHILDALLLNAKQALDHTGTISVTARPISLSAAECRELLGRAAPGGFVELAVADNGHGFSPEARQQWLARPFFSTRPRHHGLGLPIVYGICYTHGGGFRIDDSDSRGTCVRVFLPACRSAGT